MEAPIFPEAPVIEARPQGIEAARHALANRDLPAARLIWAELRRRFPDTVEAYAEDALALVRAKRYDEAAALQAAAIERFPEQSGLRNDYAWTAMFAGDSAEAARRWQDMRACFPDHAEGHVYGAAALRRIGRLEEAEAIATAALPRFPALKQLWIEHAEAALQQRDIPEAVRRWEGVVTRFPTEAESYDLGSRVLRTAGAAESVTRALSLLDELKCAYPAEIHPYSLQAELLARQGAYDAALEAVAAAPIDGAARDLQQDMVFRGLRLAVYLAAANRTPVFAEPAVAPAIEQAVAVMMIRDEEDIIARNLRHHYRMGLRKFVILLNCCADATPAIVERFRRDRPDVVLCTLTDPAEGYYQADKTQAAIDFAGAYFAAIRRPVSWCFVLDADEFISIDGDLGLAGLIAQAEAADKDFITFHFCNGISGAKAELGPEDDIYAFFDLIVGCVVPVVTKNAFRLGVAPRIGMGNHALWYPGVTMERAHIAARAGARFIHLPYRSRAQLRTKLVNGATAYEATDLDREQGGHWRRPYKRLLVEGDTVITELLENFHQKTMRDARHQAPFAF